MISKTAECDERRHESPHHQAKGLEKAGRVDFSMLFTKKKRMNPLWNVNSFVNRLMNYILERKR